uniref:HRDC domain-containing protein n=3 Tax=Nocardia TaxID=1817 RepID=UPI002454EAA4
PAARDREANRPRCRVCAKPLIGTYATMLGRCRRCPGEVDAALLDALKQWRAEKAADRGVREFVVLTDTTLTAIAEQLPADDRALGAIAGFGPKKIADHGAEILAIVASRMKAARNDSGAQQPAPAVADARARQGARRGKNHKTAGQK